MMERPGRLRSALVTAFCLLLGLAAAEGLVRAYAHLGGAVGSRLAEFDPLAVLVEPHGRYGYRQRPNRVFRFYNGTSAKSNALGYRGPAVSFDKPDGTTRVLLLGGSTTHGFGVDDDATIDHYMRGILSARRPDRRFEVVNLALDGYDAYQIYERMQSDGVRFDPDLVIVNAGINDVRNARIPDLADPDPRTLIWEEELARMRDEAQRGGPGAWTRVKHHVYLTRLPGFARSLKRDRDHGQRVVEKEALEPNRQAIEAFGTNLRRTADLAADVGAGLVLSTAPSALTTRHEPADRSHISYWIVDAQTTERFRLELAARMQQVASELREAGRPVRYVSHELPPDLFIDDCHLTADGNRALAERLVGPSLSLLEEAS